MPKYIYIWDVKTDIEAVCNLKQGAQPVRNLNFVGAGESDVWAGYMKGAVRLGVRGAREVIERV